jgi:hypothetical protein
MAATDEYVCAGPARDRMLTIPAAAPKHSLTDEARWQSTHRSAAFEAGKKLRDLPIQFVSAGNLEGTLKEQSPLVETGESHANASPAPSSPSSTPDNSAAMAHMGIRSSSPAVSDVSTSSDVVVFVGRGNAPPVKAAPSRTLRSAESLGPPAATFTPPISAEQITLLTPASHHTSVIETVTRGPLELSFRPKVAVNSDSDGSVEDHFLQRRGDKPAWEGTTTAWESRSKPNIGWLPAQDRPDMEAVLRGDINPRDAAMDDYMQNVHDFGLTGDMMEASGFARREMDLEAGSHNEWESTSGSHKEEDADLEEYIHDNDNWDSDLMHDFEDMSTSSDVMDTVVRILLKRTRKSGLQYLCVYEGSVTDDARWLPATFLKSGAEKKLIRSFEEEAHLRELVSSDSDSEATDDDDMLDDGDEELDDETIARVLQKQEELGLGSDEVLLYGGDEFFRSPFNANTSFRNHGRPNNMRQARGRGKREPNFPSASAMADALAMDPYGGFDIMDTERPSLKQKKKGRRGQMPPELDDSDLNEQMQKSWEADRVKKRLKKAEREELRQQGLLGRKGKAADLTIKYQGGIDNDDIVEEIRDFLLSDRQSLSLPPMEAYRRATVHQAAKFFELSSRSRGDGKDRFTVLSRTSRTRFYSDTEVDRAMAHKGFMKRLRGTLPGKKGPGPARGSNSRSGPRARLQTGYREGDKVGEHAPELGPENKGHALMMKMGWSKGMALGTQDNQGILHPIAHTVKTNKAGLQ